MALSCQECPVSSMPSTLTPTRTLRRLLAAGMEGVQIKLGMVVVEEEGGLVLEGDWVAVLPLGEGGMALLDVRVVVVVWEGVEVVVMLDLQMEGQQKQG